jgi:hypothetical protein
LSFQPLSVSGSYERRIVRRVFAPPNVNYAVARILSSNDPDEEPTGDVDSDPEHGPQETHKTTENNEK